MISDDYPIDLLDRNSDSYQTIRYTTSDSEKMANMERLESLELQYIDLRATMANQHNALLSSCCWAIVALIVIAVISVGTIIVVYYVA